MPPTDRCETCRFFELFTEHSDEGFCHRYPPPRQHPGDTERGIFPIVGNGDWCGEHQPRREGGE